MAQTVTVDFDEPALVGAGGIPGVPIAGNFNPHLTFSTEIGATVLLLEAGGQVGASPPNSIFVAFDALTGPFDPDFFVDFTVPVNNLSFNVAGDNDVGQIATQDVFVNGAVASTLAIDGNGDFTDVVPVDLSSFAGVTRVEITSITDTSGLVYDDFNFAPIPERTTAWLFATGLLALGVAMRRR